MTISSSTPCPFPICSCHKISQENSLSVSQKKWLKEHQEKMTSIATFETQLSSTNTTLERKKAFRLLSQIPILKKILEIVLKRWNKKSITQLHKNQQQFDEILGAIKRELREEALYSAHHMPEQPPPSEPSQNGPNQPSLPSFFLPLYQPSTPSQPPSVLHGFVPNDVIHQHLHDLFQTFCDHLGAPTIQQTDKKLMLTFPTRKEVVMNTKICEEVLEKKGIQSIIFSMQSNTISLCKINTDHGERFAFSSNEVKVTVTVKLPVVGDKSANFDFGWLYLHPECMKDEGEMLTVQLTKDVPASIRVIFKGINKIIGHSVRLYKMTDLANHRNTQWKTPS